MAQTAKTGIDRASDNAKDATDNVAELGKRAVDQANETTREVADRSEDLARRGAQTLQRTANAAGEIQREVTHRSAEGSAEIGRVLVDLASEQTRHNLETLNALTSAVDWDKVAKAVDWDRVFQIQSEYLRVSLERSAQLTRRYFEISQSVMASAASVAKRQARKAA
jgi:hypothetical protein